MTKADIVDVIASGTGLTKVETEAVVDGFKDLTKDDLSDILDSALIATGLEICSDVMAAPGSGAQSVARESLQAELLDIHARTGKTVLFVTHDLDEAVLIADRIVVMKHGRVHEIMDVPLKRPRPDLGMVRGTPEFAETRYKVWRAIHDDAVVH